MRNNTDHVLGDLPIYSAAALVRGMKAGIGTRVWDWPASWGKFHGHWFGWLGLTILGEPKSVDFIDSAEYPYCYHSPTPANIASYGAAMELLLAEAFADRPLCQLSGEHIVEITPAALAIGLARYQIGGRPEPVDW